jgi:hypothetical protein
MIVENDGRNVKNRLSRKYKSDYYRISGKNSTQAVPRGKDCQASPARGGILRKSSSVVINPKPIELSALMALWYLFAMHRWDSGLLAILSLRSS